MISWGQALRELERRRGRALLSLLSVVIAVAAIVAVTSATATTRQAYQQVFQALAGRADLEVVAHGGGHFHQNMGEKLRSLDGVRAVLPVFHRATIVHVHGTKAKVLAVGIQPDDPESVAGFQVTAGVLPRGANEIAFAAELAKSLHVELNDEVRLLTSRGLRAYTICGLVTLDSAVRLHQGGMILAPLERLQRTFKATGEVDALHLFLNDPKQASQVMTAAARLLPDELSVRVPAARSGLAQETMLLTEVSLNLASALSFTTAVFIALSVFLMNVGERRRELSILRAIGATRRQIVGMVCREALVMGVLGTLVGIPLGIFGGRYLIRSMDAMLHANLPETPDLRWAFAAGGLLGPLICLVAAWYPARKASQVSPLEGMRPVVTLAPRRGHRGTTLLGLAGLALTAGLAIGCVRGVLPIWLAIVGVILSLVSLVFLLPIVLSPAMSLVSWPLRGWAGVEREMSERLVLRHAGRSALTIGVLLIAVSAGIGTSNAVFSITDDVRNWYERTITADFLLRTMMPDMNGQAAAGMEESLGDEIAALDNVQMVEPVRFLRIDVGGRDAILVARNFRLYDRVPLDVVGGDSPDVLDRLRDGEAVVASVLAAQAKLRIGDELKLTFGERSASFRVAGITSEYAFGGSVVYIDRGAAERIFHIDGVDSFLIQSKPNQAQALAPQLALLAERHGLLLQSFHEVLAMIDSMVAGVTGGLWVLLTLGLLVGALGVVNTLTMNVLEQVRELGMLRAIGMRRDQIVRTVLGQAAFIGAVGVGAGLISGLVLARMINICLGSMFGHYVPFSVRPQFVALLVVVALAVVMISALLPARRAARLNPIQAMGRD